MELLEKLKEIGAFDRLLPLTISAPTGSGKTYAAFELARQFLERGDRVVYLTPLRAQAHEIHGRYKNQFPSVGLVMGGRPLKGGEKAPALIISTYESLFARFANWRRNLPFIASIGLLIIDEIHLLESPSRGGSLEHLLSWAKRINPRLILLSLSGTIGPDSSLLSFLESGFLLSTHRPVPLSVRAIAYEKVKQREVLGDLMAEQKSTLVFVHSRKKARELANSLREQGILATHHHGGLTQKERRAVEQAIMNRKVSVVVATPTLEMGLNLPVERVICLDLYFHEEGRWRLLSKRSLHQRLGRAGRPGLDPCGEGIVMIPRGARAGSLMTPGFDPLVSTFSDHRHQALFVLREIAHGFCNTPDQLERAFATTLAGAQGTPLHAHVHLQKLLEAKFLEHREEKLHVSPSVRTALSRFVDPFFYHKIHGLFLEALTPFDGLFILCLAPGVEISMLSQEEISTLHDSLSGFTSCLLPARLSALMESFPLSTILRALKAACVISQRTQEAESPWEINHLSIENTVETVLRYGGVLGESSCYLEDKARTTRLRTLLAQVRGMCHGLSPEASLLTLLPGLGPSHVRKLCKNNISSLQDLVKTDESILNALLKGPKPKNLLHGATTLLGSLTPSPIPRGKPVFLTRHDPSLDLLRLYRGTFLRVISLTEGRHQVQGPFSSYEVTRDSCTCPDFATGHRCKHILARDLFTGEANTPEIPSGSFDFMDLGALWFHQHQERNRNL
ncbi:DEAD/DEAH box helicase [Myxococcota bacterium]|nr:DEAD/DEAH box helicase [Myxococcota bacterium]MBU1535350.1 DEAD/DEAH box helicase [Myxococcota bacterium]